MWSSKIKFTCPFFAMCLKKGVHLGANLSLTHPVKEMYKVIIKWMLLILPRKSLYILHAWKLFQCINKVFDNLQICTMRESNKEDPYLKLKKIWRIRETFPINLPGTLHSTVVPFLSTYNFLNTQQLTHDGY